MERMDMLGLIDNMSQIVELMRKSKNLDSALQVMQGLNQHIIVPLIQFNHAVKKQLGDHLANIGGPEALMKYASLLSSQGNQNDTNDAYGELCMSVLPNALYPVVSMYANASLEFGHAVGRSGLLMMTVQKLTRHLEMEFSDANLRFIHVLLGILGPCARVPENLDYFKDIGAVDPLKKLIKEANMPLRMTTLCCLAHIVDAEDPDLTQLQASDIDFFMNILNATVSEANHEIVLEKVPWIAIDVVKDLLALSRHDSVKCAFVRNGVMVPLIQLIEFGNSIEQEYAMLCVQSFVIVDSIRETIVSESRVEEVLRALLTQQDQIYAVHATARKTLKCLGMEPTIS
ncbi:uncharacterized protein LOC144866127 [Branchiostoma floridae x Branchiostoma japonicum]